MGNHRSAPKQASGRKHLMFGLITVLLSSAFVLIAAEGYLRLTQPYYTAETLREQSLQFVPSSLARYILVPNQQLESPNIRINAQGYRGRDFTREKAPGTTRIMFLGGSMVFTIATSDGQDWPSLTGEELGAMGIENVEIMNVGVPGNHSADSLGRFYGELWAYQPDYVVICMAWNDIKNIVYHTLGRSLLRASRPVDPNTDPRQNYQSGPDRFLSEHSQIYVRLRTRYYDWKIPSGVEGAISDAKLMDEFQPESLGQFRITLELIADAVRHSGGTPVFVTQPTLVSPNNTPEERARISYGYVRFSHDALLEALKECRKIAMEIAEDQDVPLIDAYPRMSGRSEYFRDHVHTSPEGSREIAKIVAEGLAPLLRENPDPR